VTYGDSKLGMGGARQQPSELLCGGNNLQARWFKSGLRNQSFFSFNHFRKPCNHPNCNAAVEIRESCV